MYFTLNGFSLITSLFAICFSSRSSRLSESTFEDIPPTLSFSSLKPIDFDSRSSFMITGCHFLDSMFAVAVSGHQSLLAHATGTLSDSSVIFDCFWHRIYVVTLGYLVVYSNVPVLVV